MSNNPLYSVLVITNEDQGRGKSHAHMIIRTSEDQGRCISHAKELEVTIAVNETLDESCGREHEIQATTRKTRKRTVTTTATKKKPSKLLSAAPPKELANAAMNERKSVNLPNFLRCIPIKDTYSNKWDEIGVN